MNVPPYRHLYVHRIGHSRFPLSRYADERYALVAGHITKRLLAGLVLFFFAGIENLEQTKAL